MFAVEPLLRGEAAAATALLGLPSKRAWGATLLRWASAAIIAAKLGRGLRLDLEGNSVTDAGADTLVRACWNVNRVYLPTNTALDGTKGVCSRGGRHN